MKQPRTSTSVFDDTIFALASGLGRAGVAVFRLSGPKVLWVLTQLTGAPEPEPRKAILYDFKDPSSGELLDRGLAIYFKAPNSFTGEDVVELHTHGGRAVIAAVTDALGRLPGCRLAEPGEFSRRAFEHGKMDLTSAEAIADLVDADTTAQRRQALRQMDGELGRLYDSWRHRLMKILAHAEAVLDFPDEGLPPDVASALWAQVKDIHQQISVHLQDSSRGERLREGFRVTIVGAPNAGKSTLLNTLAQRDAAIVSAHAGTTRDVIDVHLDLGGYPVIVADTAGLRDTHDSIEAEGIRRARHRAAEADLKIALFDAAALSFDEATVELVDANTLCVLTKIDALPPDQVGSLPTHIRGQRTLPVSGITGQGMAPFLQELEAIIRRRLDSGSEHPPLTRARHRAALEQCVQALAESQAATLPELAAEDLRIAMRELGKITGRVDMDDMLDIIFRDFCIGK